MKPIDPLNSAPGQRLLWIEDNPDGVPLIRKMLHQLTSGAVLVDHADSMLTGERRLVAEAFDAVLLDLGLPDARGLAAVRRARLAAPGTPLVVLTGLDDEELAVDALREGAQDYLVKSHIDTRGLLRALRYAIERKAMETALRAAQERAQATLDCIADAVVCVDVEGRITFLNKIAETMTGWNSAQAEGRPLADVIRIVDAATRKPLPNPLAVDAEEDRCGGLTAQGVLLHRGGGEIAVEDSVARIRSPSGALIGSVVVFRDVGVARALEAELQHAAHHDALTGLPNRVVLDDRIGQAIAMAARHRKSVAVLFLDLDGFKDVNDSLGHATGDLMLRSFAARLVDCVRVTDTVSRQGGDEFVVLLPEVESREHA
jgi:PAS domain S-box-containing protein